MKKEAWLALSLCAAVYTHADTGVNVVGNGDFETVSGGGRAACWSYGGGWRHVDGAGTGGSGALVYENGDPGLSANPFQNVELEKGRVYAIEADVKIEGSLKGPYGKGVCVYAEWYDAKGGYIGGVYTEEIGKTGGEWLHVSSICAAISTNASTFRIGISVAKGCTGKVVFDNVKLARWYNPRLQGLYTSAYRDTAAGGVLELMAALDLTDVSPDGYTGVFGWLGSDGRRRSSAPASMDVEFARLPVDVGDIAMGRSTVSFTLVKPDGEVDAKREIRFERVAEMPRRSVAVDDRRRTIVGGKPFFPIGVYGGSGDMAMLRRIGVNTLMLYGAPEKDVFDAAETNGLMVIAGINHVFAGTRHAPRGVRSDADEVAWLEKYVGKVRSHPALLAWYALDELPLTMLPRLASRRDLLAGLDPDHPVWICMNHPCKTRSYLPALDIAGADPYPVQHRPIAMAADWTRSSVRGVGGRRGVWMVPQIFNWSSYNRTDGRVPTREEIRNMTWQCIVEGATGIIYFEWRDLRKNGKDTTFEGRLSDFASVTEEVSAFTPFLLSDDEPAEVAGTTAEVCARLFTAGGSRRLVVVNATREQRSAKLSVKGFPPFEIRLAPLEVAIKDVCR